MIGGMIDGMFGGMFGSGTNIWDELAYQGPFILTIVVLLELLLGGEGQWPFFVAFLAGFWLNNRLNELLKAAIREPRPTPFDLQAAQLRDPLRLMRRWWTGTDELYLSRAHLWGMPSGHAQLSSFALTFYYLVYEKYLRLDLRYDFGSGVGFYRSVLMFSSMCLVFMMTLYQRWETKAHTIAQLLIGTIVGCLFAGVMVFGVKWWLQETRKKKDE